MYWIVYALFSLGEAFADTLISWYAGMYEYDKSPCCCVVNRFPFYYELKLLFVFWLVLPITKVSSDHMIVHYCSVVMYPGLKVSV